MSSLDQLAAEGALALRRQVNGLIDLLAKPASWRKLDPALVAADLIDVLTTLLRVDLACVSIADASGEIDIRSQPISWAEIDRALERARTGGAAAIVELPRPNSVGKRTSRLAAVELVGEPGRVVVGSWRENFPTAGERLLLGVAVDQAVLAMQARRRDRMQARLVEEERRLVAANARLARLQRFAEWLSSARTIEEVASTAEAEVADAFSARGVAVYAFDEADGALVLVRARGEAADDAVAFDAPRVTLNSDAPVADAVRRGAIVEAALAHGISIAVPLLVGSRRVGAVQLRVDHAIVRSTDDVAMLNAVVHQIAQALDRSRLYEAERRRLAAAETSTRRLEMLTLITAALADSRTPDEVASVLVHDALPLADARSAAVWLRGSDPGELVLSQRSGSDTMGLAVKSRAIAGAHPSGAIATCLRTHEAVWTSDPTEPWLWPGGTAPDAVLGCFPLASRAGPNGVVLYVFERDRAPDPEARAMLALLSRHAGQSLERAQLYVEERRARQLAQASERRMAYLAEASARLASSLDYQSGLAGVAWLAVPRAADWCLIELVEANVPSIVAAAHVNLTSVDPLRTCWLGGVGAAIRALIRDRVTAVGDDEVVTCAWDAARRDPDLARAAAAVGMDAMIAVPIVSRRGFLGTLAFGSADRARTFTRADLEIGEELGRRAGIAIDNAMLYREAREADRRKDTFLAMLGHELRNPLAPIRIALELMRMRDDAVFPRERAVIDRQVQHLTALMEDLLDVSRIAAGKVELRRERVDLRDAVRRAIEMATPLLESRLQRFATSIADEPLWVQGDPRRLAQVVTNLLQNAAKYTPERGEVALEATRHRGEIAVRVRDSGVGIAPQMLDAIFEAFVQDQQSVDRAQGGLGLGLAIARSLVQLHGGTITAHSGGRDRGSEFVVALPAAPPTSDRGLDDQAFASAREPGPHATPLLVVDDNHDAVELMAELLTAVGYDVTVAHDGPEALRKASEACPRVAILDIGLPVMDGYELANRFRADPRLRHVALIALTGYGQRDDRMRSRAAGFSRHLVKPVDADALVDAIEDVLRESDRGSDPDLEKLA